MNTHVRPKIVISRCFFEYVRYDGGTVLDPFVEKLKNYVDFITVCPEVDIGLGVPRQRIIIVKDGENKRLIQYQTGIDLTEKMEEFSKGFLSKLENVDGFLLKSKSPSCGVGTTKLYLREQVVGRTYGFFAQAVRESMPYMPLEDEGRLRDKNIRENFLIRIFAFAELRKLMENFSPKGLVEFHSAYKYMLMTYNQKALKELGRLVAQVGKEPERVAKEYKESFMKAFSRIPSASRHANTLMHILGHISRNLNSMEKRHLLHLIQKLKFGKMEHRVIVEVLRSLAYRHNNEYLLKQRYLDPYPEDLA